jgi:hypothetical protein
MKAIFALEYSTEERDLAWEIGPLTTQSHQEV